MSFEPRLLSLSQQPKRMNACCVFLSAHTPSVRTQLYLT